MKALLGIDVGLLEDRRTTGISLLTLHNSTIELNSGLTTLSGLEQDVRSLVGNNRRLVAIAIDGPMVNGLGQTREYRAAEAVLSRGEFQKRCKPGSTSSLVGQSLHVATTQIAEQVLKMSASDGPAVASKGSGPKVVRMNLYEAFPNAFLGVMLPEAFFDSMIEEGKRTIRRGEKSDIFYQHCLEEGQLQELIRFLVPGWLPQGLLVSNHDKRAAVVCALTGLCAIMRRFVAVGDSVFGYIFLPPWELWQDWARDALKANLARLKGNRRGQERNFSKVEFWRDGKQREI